MRIDVELLQEQPLASEVSDVYTHSQNIGKTYKVRSKSGVYGKSGNAKLCHETDPIALQAMEAAECELLSISARRPCHEKNRRSSNVTRLSFVYIRVTGTLL